MVSQQRIIQVAFLSNIFQMTMPTTEICRNEPRLVICLKCSFISERFSFRLLVLFPLRHRHLEVVIFFYIASFYESVIHSGIKKSRIIVIGAIKCFFRKWCA